MKSLLSFFLFLLSVPALFAQERDLNVEAKSSTANTFVLLIGINRYPRDIPSLEYCVRDTEGLAASLQKIGVPGEQIIVMVDDAADVSLRPSGSNIRRQIEMVTGLVTANDQLVVTFSGHGAQLDGQAYLCPNDTDLERTDSFLSRKWVYDKLEHCPARKKLFITDACRNEIKVKGAKSVTGVKSLADPLGDADSHGFALLASCSRNQKSYEDEHLEHGVFTYFIMRGLEGEADADKDRRVTFEELYAYVLRNTRLHVLKTRQAAQVPVRGGEFSGDFVLAALKKIEPPIVPPTPVTTLPLPKPAEVPPIPAGRRVNVSTASQLLDAVKNARDGDVIVLAAGTYHVSESIKPDSDKGSLTLYGDPVDPGKVNLRISGKFGTIKINEGTRLTVIGLDIANGWYGVYPDYSSKAEILFCRIHDCGDCGIHSSHSPNYSIVTQVHVEHSVIVDNNGKGLTGDGVLRANNCLIKNNKDDGVSDYIYGSKWTLSGCAIVGNGDNGILLNRATTFATVTDCVIRDNKGRGVWMYGGANGEFRNNILSGNIKGNWNIKEAGQVTRSGNTPNE